MSDKQCVRCGMAGHLSHACTRPSGLFTNLLKGR